MKRRVGVLPVVFLVLFVLTMSFVSAGIGEVLCNWFGLFCKDVRQAPAIANLQPTFVDESGGSSGGSREVFTCDNNGTREGKEECDGTDFGGATCENGGELYCVDCVIKMDNCWQCGNGEVEGAEDCDSNTRSCEINGYNGIENCNAACTGYDSCQATESCGDEGQNGNEECDDGDSQNYDGCNINCKNDIADSCYENDGGQNFNIAGYVAGNYSGTNYTYYDECVGLEIKEYYCNEDDSYSYNETNCNEDFYCSNGSCVENITYFVNNVTNGTINVTSNPTNATIKDNGITIGLTPRVYSALLGTHNIKLTKTGYLPYTEDVELISGETEHVEGELEINTTNQTLEQSDLIITRFESRIGVKTGGNYPVLFSATIKNNGEANAGTSTTRFLIVQSGKTLNVRIAGINASDSVGVNGTINVSVGGNYSALAIADLFNDIHESNESNNNKSTGFVIPLNAVSNTSQNGILNVTSEPDGASIEDNGVELGLTPKIYSASIGEHDLIIRKEGYNDFSRTVQVRSNSIIGVHAKLQKQEDCVDSDGGQDYSIWGETSNSDGSSSDSCDDKKTLKEFYCEDGKVLEENKNCLDLGEYECKEGICVSNADKNFIEKLIDFIKNIFTKH